MESNEDPIRIKYSLSKISSIFGLPDSNLINKVQDNWPSIIGRDIYMHTRLISIKKSTMYIEVDHSFLIKQIKYLESNIVEKIRDQYPEIKVKNIKVVNNKKFNS